MAESMLTEFGYKVVGKARNTNEALNIISNHKVDLALLDINLDQGTEGIDLGQKLKDIFKIPFIYLTSYTNKGIIKKAALTNPVGYVIKPFSNTDLFSSIEICLANIKQFATDSITEAKIDDQAVIQIRTRYGNVKLSLNAILYIKADNVYIEIYTKEEVYTERISLKKIIEQLPQHQFIRVHRSYLVNKDHITSWTAQKIYVNYVPIPISRSYQKVLLNL
jgi:DNA-binding LytR/AlgR family response regulator